MSFTGVTTDRAFLDKINVLTNAFFTQQQFSFRTEREVTWSSQVKCNTGTDRMQMSEYGEQGPMSGGCSRS